MKKAIVLSFVMISLQGFSQLYCSINTQMYVKNQVIYVAEEVNLQSNSVLYLRNNSQLIQGTTSTSANLGTGALSVFQEGTSDNYEYNYWCSPIGNPSSSIGNTPFGVSMLYQPTSAAASTPAVLLSSTSNDGIASPLSIATRWIYKLINANDYSQWIYVGSANTINTGEGFTMKGTMGTDATDPEGTGITNNPGGTGAQRYDFRGKPNDGDITVSLGANNGTLTGNPYPSALDLNAFLLDPLNTAGTGIAYFWEQDKTVNSHYLTDYRGGYGSYAPISLTSNGIYVASTFNSYNTDGSLNATGTSSGFVIERRYSPIGQGFVLNGAVTGTVTLKNTHRAYYQEGNSLTKFEKRAFNKSAGEKVSHFKLNAIINNQFTRQLALAFLSEATDGIDRGIDALNMDQSLPNDTYFVLDKGNYVIQGLNFDETKRIPLAVKATTNTSIKFYIPEVINFNPLQEIYLYDALDGSYNDIKNGTYTATITPGNYNNRFEITFKKGESLNVVSENKNNLFISQNNTNHILSISNPDQLVLKSLIIYDISGKKIMSKKNIGTDINYYFPTSGLSHGIYIVDLQTSDSLTTSQKVYISNLEK